MWLFETYRGKSSKQSSTTSPKFWPISRLIFLSRLHSYTSSKAKATAKKDRYPLFPTQRSYICVPLTNGAARIIHWFLSFAIPVTSHKALNKPLWERQSVNTGERKTEEEENPTEKNTLQWSGFEPTDSVSRAKHSNHLTTSGQSLGWKGGFEIRGQNCWKLTGSSSWPRPPLLRGRRRRTFRPISGAGFSRVSGQDLLQVEVRKFALSGFDDRADRSSPTDLLLPGFRRRRRLSDVGTGFSGFETRFGRIVLGQFSGGRDDRVRGGLLAFVESAVLRFVDGVRGRRRRRHRRR